MFIRFTGTRNNTTGERIGGKVRQITLLNLGRYFPVKQDKWPLLCQRIEQLLQPQDDLIPNPCSDAIERAALRHLGQLIDRAQKSAPAPTN